MPAVIVPAIVAVIPPVTASMTPAARLWQASDTDHIALPHRTGHIAVELTAAALELDIVEADTEASRADLVDAEVIVDVHVAEAGAVALALDHGRTLTHSLAAHLAGALGRGAASHRWRVRQHVEFDRHAGERDRMAERDELTGPLGALDASDAGNAEHIALFGASALDQGQGGRFHGDDTLGHRHTVGVRLGRHVDAHADINDSMFGETIAHGTPFRRAVEEGLLDCGHVYQIGLRGTGYTAEDFDWPRSQGFRVVTAQECWHKSLAPLMQQVRAHLGDRPAYLSFDIDGLDPTQAPGTGTPEFGGLTVIQGYEIVRGCHGLNLVGCDLVEISPPYDTSGNTALLGANLLYEMLCVLPGVGRR